MNMIVFAAAAIALGLFPGSAFGYTPCPGCPYDPPVTKSSTSTISTSTITVTTPPPMPPPTCISACPTPTNTVTVSQIVSYTNAICPAVVYTTSTVTCSDNVSTAERTITMYIDCAPPSTITVPYTRCPTVTTISKTGYLMPPCSPTPVTICPKATSTLTTTTIKTIGTPCTNPTVTLAPATWNTLAPCSTPTTTVTTTTTTRAVVPLWGQCGGYQWTGNTECAAGAVCKVLNAYYSQCLLP
ncbi:hypothetical protein DFH27DRAFT_388175 [Peziza echinospora]|nr:hypothetical protein DFH27DRAFT_388175 [Peziza echinospora]